MTELSNRAEKAFSFAQEVPKQLITLSTAVFALTLTFAEKIERPGSGGRVYLEWAWAWYLATILLGILTLMTLAGHINSAPEDGEDTIYTPGIALFSGLQILAFFAALILTLVYGAKAT